MTDMLREGTLKDEVAIITGGGTGIGKAIALQFAHLGARVVVASRKLENLEHTVADIETQGGQALVVQTDVRDVAQVQRLVAWTKEHFGQHSAQRIQILSQARFHVLEGPGQMSSVYSGEEQTP